MRSLPLYAALRTAALMSLATLALAGCGVRTSGAADAGPSGENAVRAAVAVVGGGRSAPIAPVAPSSTAEPPALSPAADPQPCAGNTSAQFIRVSISDQHAWLCARERLVYDTAVTTGMTSGADTRTPTGSFRIQGRNTDTTLNPGTGEAFPVKYWIPFQAPAFGFHDSSWQRFPYGSARYRTQGSHGCVHMPLAAMKFLYDWVRVGATVHIVA